MHDEGSRIETRVAAMEDKKGRCEVIVVVDLNWQCRPSNISTRSSTNRSSGEFEMYTRIELQTSRIQDIASQYGQSILEQ
jgi:hypothetical protein